VDFPYPGAHRCALRRACTTRPIARRGVESRGHTLDGVWPQTGLELVNAFTEEPSLNPYHMLPNVRGDILFKLGRDEEALAEEVDRQRI